MARAGQTARWTAWKLRQSLLGDRCRAVELLILQTGIALDPGMIRSPE